MVKQKKAEGFTWGAVNRHHQHRLASTTPPLPPVRRQNHVLITNTHTHRKQRHVAVVEGRIKICLKCLCVFYSNVSNGASFKKTNPQSLLWVSYQDVWCVFVSHTKIFPLYNTGPGMASTGRRPHVTNCCNTTCVSSNSSSSSSSSSFEKIKK